MKQFVIDTTVFMKLFLEEQDSERALAFFLHINKTKANLLVPPLFQAEFLSVADSHHLDVINTYDILDGYLASNLTQVNYSKTLIQKALEIATHGYKKSGYPSIYDALYHALAIVHQCDFISAD